MRTFYPNGTMELIEPIGAVILILFLLSVKVAIVWFLYPTFKAK